MANSPKQQREIPTATTIASRKPRRNRNLSSTQVMFAVILAIGLMMAIQFSSRINAERDLNQIRDTLEREIDLLEREQRELTEQLAFVASDAYVEQWARKDARMIRAGETLIIPRPSSATLAQLQQANVVIPSAPLNTTLPEPERWEIWWHLFFDAPPPNFITNS